MVRESMGSMSWMSATAGTLPGRVVLASILVVTGIGAAVAPLLADLLSATAGVLTLSLILAAWTSVRQAPARAGTTNLLGVV